jgi:hypothetical protein
MTAEIRETESRRAAATIYSTAQRTRRRASGRTASFMYHAERHGEEV